MYLQSPWQRRKQKALNAIMLFLGIKSRTEFHLPKDSYNVCVQVTLAEKIALREM